MLLESWPHGLQMASDDFAAEEDLYFGGFAGTDGDDLGVAMPLSGLQLVLVGNDDVVLVQRGGVQQRLASEPPSGGETPFEVGLPVDVVILRTGKGQLVGEQGLGANTVLVDVRLQKRACHFDVGVRPRRSTHGCSPIRAAPFSGSKGTDSWSCTIFHTPSMRRQPRVARTHMLTSLPSASVPVT